MGKKKLYQKIEELWKKAVKLRAGMKSELGGSGVQNHAHHIIGKSTYALRYSLENGICITGGEHMKCHDPDAKVALQYQKKCLKVRKIDYDELKLLSNQVGSVNLMEMEEHLKSKIKEFEAAYAKRQ